MAFPEGRPVDEVLMIGGATRMPCVQKAIEVLIGMAPRQTVHPDEAVALGATVQVSIHIYGCWMLEL